MSLPLKPILLLADSQLLFFEENGTRFLASMRALIEPVAPKAAYLGASNGDDPNFYAIFEAAMEHVGVRDCRMVLSSFSADDAAFLAESDIILLAGGDVEKGWNVFQENGASEEIIRKYYEGALLIGVSAGAVQLGLGYWSAEEDWTSRNLIDTFKLVPVIVQAHDDKQDWDSLQEAVRATGDGARGIGISAGGGALYFAAGTLEPIRYPLHEFALEDQKITRSLLWPVPDLDVIEGPETFS
ncbi:MAG: Type 1 glutamine amidotransferase-like domain-containing protein [Pyrinomonadaceae bacterium]